MDVMAHEDLLETINSLISQETKIPVENLTLAASFKDLGIDSLDVLKLAARFEREFNIKISTAELQKIETISDIVTSLGARITN
jgi:acyl carrier protein